MRWGGLAFFGVLSLTLATGGCGSGGKDAVTAAGSRPVPYPSVPGNGGGTFNANKNLAYLQKNFPGAVISPVPWAGYWFPYQTNGITAAASKYDALSGGNAAAWERQNHGQGLSNAADWWGHCNGWTAAAILAPEPHGPKAIGGLSFSISDRKALLSEIFMEVTGDFLGTRVDDPSDFSSEAYNDVWPAQMYLALTSIMGMQKRAMAMDRYTGYQVWNQPIVAYSTAAVKPADSLGPDPEFPNFYRVNMTTTLYWVSDNVDPDIVTPAFDPYDTTGVFEHRTLTYELWLDAPPQFDGSGNLVSSGDIILTSSGGHTVAGVWKNATLPAVESHPDYMWVPTGPAPSTGFKNPRLDDSWVLSNVGGG